ncbi:hypothetical protein [Thioalkalivibrio sp. ALgr3]|uniref:hypothetical protein n=1 Tax=Thioalkalivibrio sp. ALgr3 TaxID=1239292 RepID=UPI00036041DA|nr:hypothetical protein [Thioalkalivibrio sp. ALgr3]
MDDQFSQLIVNRLDRQEKKLDDLTQAITSLARVEERMASGTDRMDGHARDIANLRTRLEELERLRWKVAGAMVLASALGGLSGTFAALEFLPALAGGAA